MIVGESPLPFDASRLDEARKLPSIKEMDPHLQPREKALQHGIHTLATSELWAIVLRTGLTGYPITELCRDLMKSNGDNLRTLERRSRDELLLTPGIGPTKAIQIEAVMEIVRRYMREKAPEHPRIKCSKDIFEMMRTLIGNLDHEQVWALYLNQSNKVMKCNCISKGGRASSIFDIKIVMKEALLQNASAIVLCHNHPSGTLQPSGPDDQITRQLSDGCRTLGLRMLDHVILSADSYYSYADNGRI